VARTVGHELSAPGARLLTPEAAATYLGLGSRWAIYRLVSSRELRVRLTGKLRIDRADLDDLIESLKRQPAGANRPPRPMASGVPPRLAPLGRPPNRRLVTTPVTGCNGQDQEAVISTQFPLRRGGIGHAHPSDSPGPGRDEARPPAA
jgi:excisionase family DNA binding protein